MLSYEIITNTSKKTGNEYTIIRMKFLLKDGTVYEMDKFATKEESALLKFIASSEELAKYLQEQEPF